MNVDMQALLSQSEEDREAAEAREGKALSEAKGMRQAVREAEERLLNTNAELEVTFFAKLYLLLLELAHLRLQMYFVFMCEHPSGHCVGVGACCRACLLSLPATQICNQDGCCERKWAGESILYICTSYPRCHFWLRVVNTRNVFFHMQSIFAFHNS